jgi:hypothetical protein
MLTRYVSDPKGQIVGFGPHHQEFWSWVWSLQRGIAPPAFVGIWPRGGGKSTSVEMAVAAVGALRSRKYALYISERQGQADDHVQNVASMFGSRLFEKHYPHVHNKRLTDTGHVKGWNRQRLICHSGFVVDAIGFDVAARGAKIEEVRPDLIILDDIDSLKDGLPGIEKKIETITKTFLPAGSMDLAVLMVQNLIHINSIFSRLAGVSEHRADFLTKRIVSGPFPALQDFTYIEHPGPQYEITGGTPLWQGMSREFCQWVIDQYGLSSFLSEYQQVVDVPDGGMFNHLNYQHCKPEQVPTLLKTVVWVDPAVTDNDNSDAHGIQIDGLGMDNKIYRLWSWEQRSTPERVLRLAIMKAIEYGAQHVGVETDQGGDLWKPLYRGIADTLRGDGIYDPQDQRFYRLPPDTYIPAFRSAKAGAGHGGKVHRATLMLAEYEKARFVHVEGTHGLLERGLRRFPRTKPFDLVDASYWSMQALLAGARMDMVPLGTPRTSIWFSTISGDDEPSDPDAE